MRVRTLLVKISQVEFEMFWSCVFSRDPNDNFDMIEYLRWTNSSTQRRICSCLPGCTRTLTWGSRSQLLKTNTTTILNTSTVLISNVSVSADHVCLVSCQKKWSGGWKWERYLGNGGSSLTPLRPPRWSCLIRRTCLKEGKTFWKPGQINVWQKHSQNLRITTFWKP